MELPQPPRIQRVKGGQHRYRVWSLTYVVSHPCPAYDLPKRAAACVYWLLVRVGHSLCVCAQAAWPRAFGLSDAAILVVGVAVRCCMSVCMHGRKEGRYIECKEASTRAALQWVHVCILAGRSWGTTAGFQVVWLLSMQHAHHMRGGMSCLHLLSEMAGVQYVMLVWCACWEVVTALFHTATRFGRHPAPGVPWLGHTLSLAHIGEIAWPLFLVWTGLRCLRRGAVD